MRPLRIRRTSPAPAKPAPNSGRRPMVLAARSLAALFAALALALTGGAWQWSASKNSRLNMVSALDPHSGDIVNPSGQHGDENFLLVGMDSRAGANANIGAGDAEDAGGARSTPSCWSTFRPAASGSSRCRSPRPGDHSNPMRGVEPRDR